MNRKKIIGITISIAVIALILFKLRTNKETTQSKVYQFDKNEAVSVQADTLRVEDIEDGFTYPGNFEPDKEAKVSAEIQGRINSVFVDAGSVVKQGQPLVQLDNSLLKLQLQSVEVQIEGLETDIKRYTILTDADAVQGVQLEKSQLGLKSARVQHAMLLEQINKSTIRSPFDGIVTGKLSEVGSFAAPGVPLLQVTDLAHLKFTINVSENDLRLFSPGLAYPVSADAYPDLSLTGKTIMVGSKANAGNSYSVQFKVSNTNDLVIRSGMFGKLHLKSDRRERGLIIPSSSITGTAEKPQVYLIRDGKARLQDIAVSRKIQNKSVVGAGLNDGDVIVINGLINLAEGKNVKIEN